MSRQTDTLTDMLGRVVASGTQTDAGLMFNDARLNQRLGAVASNGRATATNMQRAQMTRPSTIQFIP